MLSSPLLVLLAQVVGQAAGPGYTPAQQFWIDLSDRWLPFLFVLAGLIGTYLKLRSVEKGINGRMSQLIASTEQKAKAEGKLEGVTEVAPQVAQSLTPPPAPVQVVIDPDARAGGRRKLDPKIPDSSVPVDQDPGSHLR